MTISALTNTPAMTALQNLSTTNSELDNVQNVISTGLAVSSAKDNASVYSIAQSQRSDLSSLQAVTESLNRADSIASVASAAGANISDLLNQMRQKVVGAMDTSIDTTSRNALNQDFQSILQQVAQSVQNATFNGTNLLDGSLTSNISFIANADASASITLSTRTMALGGPIITIPSSTTIDSASSAAAVLTMLDASIANVNSSLGALGSQQTQIEGHLSFVSKLEDAIQGGIGNLVDADMATESSKLQALQVQQQLGTQSLSIANQAPQQILSLFK